MKKSLLSVFISFILIITMCSCAINNSIIGKWQLLNKKNEPTKVFWTFYENGTSDYYTDNSNIIKYEIKENNLIMKYDDGNEVKCTFEIKNDVLTIVSPDPEAGVNATFTEKYKRVNE